MTFLYVTGVASSPETRGSFDIISSSFLATFLCTWSSLCLNVPHPDDSDLKVLLRKAKWMLWGILMPEVVLSISFGQYASAQRSVKRFREIGYPSWTLRHGFFADMGGILLLPEGGTPFVINSSQVALLVEKGHMEYPKITADEIWDKSKADFLSKSFAFLQAAWFIFQLLGRAALRLPTTALEIFTGAIVICSLGNSVCWLHKPNDIRKSVTVRVGVTLEQIVSGGEDAAAIFRQHIAHTDEVPPKDPSLLKAFGLSRSVHRQPLMRFSNGTFPELNIPHKLVFFFLGKGYAAFHLAAWNSHFPTHFELLGWRVASSVVTGASLILWAFEVLLFAPDGYTWSKYLNPLHHQKVSSRQVSTKVDVENSASDQTGPNFSKAKERNIRLSLHPYYRVVIRATLVPLYVIGRLLLLVESLTSLRAQPPDVYSTFSVAKLVSH
ncbi:hypothetical protein GGR58DRAFT_528213 [Xylaria digitata]|nr:hypothetical protein GGR58DRAFT_528213 [Xylaria digitata]